MIAYIKNSWMKPEKLVQRALYMREDYQHTNTNNLVESWHATLKRQHMENVHDMRGDDLVHLLTGVVDIDFRTHHFKVAHGLEPVVLSDNDKAIKAKAMVLSLDTFKNMVAELDQDKKFMVNSFTAPNVKYAVHANAKVTCFLTCTCPDYIRHKIPCKYLYLPARVYNSPDISHDGSDKAVQNAGASNDGGNNGDDIDSEDDSEDEIPAS
ncbi:hypothetical protein BGZ47_001453 [Haplosporangium gracile]|nr:hypothetical protein BGZ47_001453 [Haplosporangium gracile]